MKSVKKWLAGFLVICMMVGVAPINDVSADTSSNVMPLAGEGTIGEYVPVAGIDGADDVAPSNKGWVEVVAPVPETVVGGTTRYQYTKDTDGYDVGASYLIVDYDGDNAVDNNGTNRINAKPVLSTDAGNKMIANSRDYEWIIESNGKISTQIGSTTYYLRTNGGLITDNESNATTFTIEFRSETGDYLIRSGNYSLNINNDWVGFGNGSYAVRLYKFEKVINEGGSITSGKNGQYVKITGNLSYSVEKGISKNEAIALVRQGITGYSYEAMAAPGNNVGGTALNDDSLKWEWIDDFDGNTAGDYAVKISYGDKELGMVEVVVPSTTTYYIAEGNSLQRVPRNMTADTAMAVVKSNITVSSALDANGANKTEISDDAVTWRWVDTFNGTETGPYTVELLINGTSLGTLEVEVLPPVVNDYPEYPNEGAVKTNKTATGIDFQSSGIAQVELSASGVPVKRGADVIVMLDTSSSMKNNSIGGKTRAQVLEESLTEMIKLFKTPGDDGQLLDIRVAIADFNGLYGDGSALEKNTPYDRDADDMMQDRRYYTPVSKAQVYTGTKNLTAGAFIPAEQLASSYTFTYTQGTNYDYAMDAVYQLGTAIKSADRDLYVIFMSDGATMQWNYYHSLNTSTKWNSWLTGAWSKSELTSSNLNCTEHAYYYDEVDHDGDGMLNEHRMANAIKGDPEQEYEVIRKKDGLGVPTGVAGEENMYYVPGLGAKMFSIAFDLKDDGQVTAASMKKSIASIASDQTGSTQYYYEVTSANQLTDAFKVIGAEITYAASNARMVDKIGNRYSLQLKPHTYSVVNNGATTNKTIEPKIEVISYDIYTRQDYETGKITQDKIGDRKGTYTVLETVTFSADGTKAYSDQIDSGKTNILADGSDSRYQKGVIYAKTFLYNTGISAVAVDGVDIPTSTGSSNMLDSEAFYWKLGTVQSNELALRYYVYLEGSLEGTTEAGSHPTNEYANLYYDNYLGNPCKIESTAPTVAWKSANVSYAFYLVNQNGDIIVNQTSGETGSFANKIAVTKPVVYKELPLNNTNQVQAIDVKAISDDVLPKYYELYDSSAAYAIRVNSNSTGSWTITKGGDKKSSTYITNYSTTNATAYSNELTNTRMGDDYTHTVVWFAVVWSLNAHPDSVVVDYGLPVDIAVLSNDMFGEYGRLAGVGTYTNGLEDITADQALPQGFGDEYIGKYGSATANYDTGKVRYSLNKTKPDGEDKFHGMQMQGYEKFAYSVAYNGGVNSGYYYDIVTVIPATTIYYEDDFLTYSGYGTSWTDEGTKINGVQDEDRPGKYSLSDANNIYGYDSANLGMSTFSMGAAKKVHISGDSYATAEFSFYGTGFDVISMTTNLTGVIAVQVKDASGTTVASKVVDTYYGYEYIDGKWVLQPDTAKAIYQVPVLQIEKLPYGKYSVKITATYADIFDHTSPDGYDLYLDAIRIYDPANDGLSDGSTDTTIESAYAADGEGWPSYIELRNKIIAANSFDDVANAAMNTPMEGLVFIDGDEMVGDAQMSDYISYGPNNEIYLAPNQRVAFILNVPANAANVHIGIKSADGNAGTYTITNIARVDSEDGKIKAGDYYSAKTNSITTTTDMYYDLTPWKNDIIVISNTGNRYNTTGVISITNVKSTYTSDPGSNVTPVETLAVDDLNDEEVYLYMTPSAAKVTIETVNTWIEEDKEQEVIPCFVDVNPGDYFYDPVYWAVKNKITTGTDATHFSPENECTRAQMVTFLYREAGEPDVKDAKNPFVDVKESDYFYRAVLWAVEEGITTGIDATHFAPDALCTRAQMVTFLYREEGKPEVENEQNPFVDVKSAEYYYEPVLWAVENGITTGMDATHFAPDNMCLRGQAITFIYRAFK